MLMFRRIPWAARLAIGFSLGFALVASLLGIGIYWTMRGELRGELDQRILTEQHALVRQAGGAIDAAVANRVAHGGSDMRYALYAGDRFVAGQPVQALPAPGWSDNDFREANGDFDTARSYAEQLPDGRLLIVGADPESVERMDERMLPAFALAFGLMGAIGIGGGFWLSGALRRRIGAMTRAADAIIAGDLHQRMPMDGSGDEFDRLATTLNTMLDRIGALMDNLRQVSTDIAHDMRMPLARLRQSADLALAGDASDPERLRETLLHMIDQSDEMLALFNAMLTISEIEAGGAALRKTPFDLSALATDLGESYAASAEDSGKTLSLSVAPDLTIDGNRELAAQLIVNLLDNALRHTPEGAAIAVALVPAEGTVALSVADNGPGIPAGERDRVFSRFTRLERSRSTPGHGLGLSLVAAIARAHDATIRLEDNQPGVRMTVTFPSAAS